MADYTELVEALRYCVSGDCENCSYFDKCKENGTAMDQLHNDAADAIEALQAEVQFYKALADNWQESAESKERLLGLYRAELYRAEPTKHFYSATDNNGRVIQNPCACMNIPVFPDSSESPNS